MTEWEDITITGHDKARSRQPSSSDTKLGRQLFTLSEKAPVEWAAYFNTAAKGAPGREGRVSEVMPDAFGITLRHLSVHGGPNIFDKRDADHLKTLVAFANDKYRESLQAMDLSGLDAFD